MRTGEKNADDRPWHQCGDRPASWEEATVHGAVMFGRGDVRVVERSEPRL